MRYRETIVRVIDRKWLVLGIYALVCLVLVRHVLPPADRLPADRGPGRSAGPVPASARRDARTARWRCSGRSREYFAQHEAKNVETLFTVAGGGGGGGAAARTPARASSTSSTGTQRRGKENTRRRHRRSARRAPSAACATRRCSCSCRGAIRGLGQSNGFTMELQNRSGHEPRRNSRPRATSCSTWPTPIPKLTGVRLSDLPDVADAEGRCRSAEADRARASTRTTSNTTLSTAWGGRYVNDFIDKGRVKRVYVQGDAPYPRRPAEPRPMVRPLARPARWRRSRRSRAPAGRRRRAACRASAACRRSRSRASRRRASARARRWTRCEELADQIPGTSVAWAGQSYQERLSSGQAPLLYAISLLVVFLCLAALYESWSIPVAVLLVIPLGLVGAIFAVTLRGLAERRLSADRPADDHGPCGQERDPDDRVRRTGREARARASSTRRSRRRASACGRS